MNFKKWVKSIQTAGYNGARTVYNFEEELTASLYLKHFGLLSYYAAYSLGFFSFVLLGL